MKENSFDVPAFKFHILVSKPEDLKNYAFLELARSIITRRDGFEGAFIPFENIDGLPLEIMNDLYDLENNVLSLTCGIYTEGNNLGFAYEHMLFDFYHAYKDGIYDPDDRIDEIIADNLISAYDNGPDFVKSIIKCFLQRYQCKDMASVMEKINGRQI